jgi:hypothetical protein
MVVSDPNEQEGRLSELAAGGEGGGDMRPARDSFYELATTLLLGLISE